MKEAVSGLIRRRGGPEYEPYGEIVVTPSDGDTVLNALLALTDPGDEVILTDPTYAGAIQRVRVVGAVPRLVPLRGDEDGWRLDLDALRAAVSDATRRRTAGGPGARRLVGAHRRRSLRSRRAGVVRATVGAESRRDAHDRVGRDRRTQVRSSGLQQRAGRSPRAAWRPTARRFALTTVGCRTPCRDRVVGHSGALSLLPALAEPASLDTPAFTR